MKPKFKALLRRLVLWAAGDYFDEQLQMHLNGVRTGMHHARDHLAKENAKQWQKLNAKIAALQAIDVPHGRDVGKIVVIARVGGQDIVKIIDIEPNIPHHAFKDMVEELKARYGARPEFLDAAYAERIHLAQALGMPDSVSRAAKRDLGGLGGW